MTKEEVASIVKYCNDNGVSYKARLSELGVPEWKFFVSKRRYAKEQASSASPAGEFLQLTAGGDIVPMPSFTFSGRYPFSDSGDIRSRWRQFQYGFTKLIFFIRLSPEL